MQPSSRGVTNSSAIKPICKERDIQQIAHSEHDHVPNVIVHFSLARCMGMGTLHIMRDSHS